MSRSGYTEETEYPVELWRRAVGNAMRGKRGQAFLRDLVAHLDAMPVKALVRSAFEEAGSFCALGVVGHSRGIDLSKFNEDPDDIDFEALGRTFGIAPAMAQEVMYLNDDDFAYNGTESPEARWERMRAWAVSCLAADRQGAKADA